MTAVYLTCVSIKLCVFSFMTAAYLTCVSIKLCVFTFMNAVYLTCVSIKHREIHCCALIYEHIKVTICVTRNWLFIKALSRTAWAIIWFPIHYLTFYKGAFMHCMCNCMCNYLTFYIEELSCTAWAIIWIYGKELFVSFQIERYQHRCVPTSFHLVLDTNGTQLVPK